MSKERETQLLEWFGGASDDIGELTDDDFYLLAKALGITGAAADVVVEHSKTYIDHRVEWGAPAPRRNAIFYGLSQLPLQGPVIAQQAAGERGRVLALRESPDIAVPNHGTLKRGRSNTGIAGSRPHMYLWFRPNPNSPCNEYAWYQFGQVNLRVNNRDETGTIGKFSFDTAGGAKMTFGEWRADYVKPPLDRVNTARRAAGKQPLPEFTPPNFQRSPINTKKPKGKAYIGVSIPGHRGDGIVDAPNLCYRGPNPDPSTASTLDRAAEKYARKQKQQVAAKPDDGTMQVAVVINFRSYLVCIDPAISCIGYVEWSYTSSATFNYTWIRSNANPFGNLQWYRAKVTGRDDCTHTLTIGGFNDC